MDNEVKSLLFDILNAIAQIETFISELNGDFDGYKKDLKTKRAVERNLEIIGEAMSRLLARDETIQLSNSRKIVDTRNRIIRGYNSISDEALWSIILKHLPLLKIELENLLK